MKNMIAVLYLLWGVSAAANDGGMPYIEVNDLTFTDADVGTKITFKGPEAMSLYNALPSMDVMNSSRGFTATGKKKSVFIRCKALNYNEKTGEFDKISDGPVCSISVDKAFTGSGGDDSKWIHEREPQSVKDAKKTKKK